MSHFQSSANPAPPASPERRTLLHLTRRIGESIQIGDDVTVRVERIGRDGVRLSIEAPPSVRVDRTEVAERRRAEGPRSTSLQLAV